MRGRLQVRHGLLRRQVVRHGVLSLPLAPGRPHSRTVTSLPARARMADGATKQVPMFVECAPTPHPTASLPR